MFIIIITIIIIIIIIITIINHHHDTTLNLAASLPREGAAQPGLSAARCPGR